jgi:ribosome-binding ATPase YchF (GTP1/OBG family)
VRSEELEGELLRIKCEREENLRNSGQLDAALKKAQMIYKNVKEEGYIEINALEESLRTFENLNRDKIRDMDLLCAKVEAELEKNKREITKNWEDKVIFLEEGIQRYHFEINQQQKEVLGLAEAFHVQKGNYDLQLTEKSNHFTIEEKARYESNIRGLENSLLVLKEGMDFEDRRGVERLREFELKEKSYIDIIMTLEQEYTLELFLY